MPVNGIVIYRNHDTTAKSDFDPDFHSDSGYRHRSQIQRVPERITPM